MRYCRPSGSGRAARVVSIHAIGESGGGLMSSARATAFGAIVGAVSVRPAVLAGLGKARAGWRGAVIGVLVVGGARVARTEV